MARLSAGEAAAAAGGRVVAGDPQAPLSGAAIDSRAVRGGELFFAFSGAHADGHRFVGDAFGRGAAGAVVRDLAAAAASWPPLAAAMAAAAAPAVDPARAPAPGRPEAAHVGVALVPSPGLAEAADAGAAPPPSPDRAEAADDAAASRSSPSSASPTAGPAVIQVADTLAALHEVARSVRRRVPRRLVGITGSAGKTTTKELLAAMLARRFRVARNPGNFNNLYGFPLALLNVSDDTEWMVAELGMSTPGELRQLSLLGRPDVALFTVVRPAHLQAFDSLRGIADAKAELLAGLAPDGLLVANADDPEVVRIAVEGAGRRRVVWYGISAAAAQGPGPSAGGDEPAAPPRVDVAARGLVPGPGGIGSRFTLWAGGQSQEVRLPLHGLYNVENCLAAAACAFTLGVPLAEIAAAAAEARPAAGRGVVHRVEGRRGGLTVIDDSYNSNPDALEKALAGAAQLPAARRLAVLGDMLELGTAAPRFHREGGRAAARLGFGPLLGVGELARELAAGASEGGAAADWRPDAAAAADWAAGTVRAGDVVLVKGSRGVGLDAVVRRLLALAADGAGGEDGEDGGAAGAAGSTGANRGKGESAASGELAGIAESGTSAESAESGGGKR
jgi:UDP-N-acetylmuramoyl-tripeptide--D-alanyl-D-alanine ligase